jgi:hypothetical protein
MALSRRPKLVPNAHPWWALLITTPFLIKVHGAPFDCSRWTKLGIRHFLAEAGFDVANITTGSAATLQLENLSLQNVTAISA